MVWATLAAIAANCFAAEVPRVIFDTDMYTDYDDVGALAILHTLADAGECEIIAVGSNTWGEGNKSVAVCEIINAYYGRPDIPVGCARSGGRQGPGDAGYGLPEQYPNLVRHAVSTNAPPAVDVYRAALAAAPDRSVVLCSVGFLNNVADLLRADRALVARKVARWVCMACDYPKGKEYNSKHDPAASAYAFANWPTNVPITFVDFPIGRHCYAGRAVAELPDTANPIRDAFRNRLTPRHKVVPGESWDQMAGHPSWDEIAALVAVRGLEPYFGLQRGAHRMVGTDGENVWTDDLQSPHGRVTFKSSPDAVGRALDELMCRPPARPWGRRAPTRPDAQLSLNGAWKLSYWPEPDSGAQRTLPAPAMAQTVTATVPGNCELDLVRAGILPPPEIGLNARAFRPYEGYQWLYEKAFEAPAVADGGRAVLVFDGIDTLADVFLNGVRIGETDNMLVAHRFDVTERLKPGTNVVQVLLRSVLLDAKTKTLGELGYTMQGGAEGEPYRKAGHMGGWDIFPRLFVSGLWRDVRVETQGPIRIDQTSWIVKSIDRAARRAELVGACRIDLPFAELDRAQVTVGLCRAGKVVAQQTFKARHFQQSFALSVSDAAFWWPRGFGEPALYEAFVEVVGADGTRRARHAERIGLRTVELVRDDIYGPDRPGQFLFKVNGEPLYVRGANWVPLDALHGRAAERLLPTLELFRDLNCNMIRVWGGGVYEPDAFFDWCDENGVLVWQDFMTGCSMFPFDPDYQRRTREEAIQVVLRFRNHPSLALWSGNNENDGAPRWRLGDSAAIRWDPTEDVTSRVTLPAVVREFDVTRPYLPSSPYYSPDVVAGRATPSEEHLWGARAYYKVPFYTNAPCWFASEMGYHGCPNRASLERMMTPDHVYPWTKVTGKDPKRDYHWNEEWQFKASDAWLNGFGFRRNSLMTNQVKLQFGDVPTDLDDFILASQIVQAEAMKTFVELFRSQKFTRKNGLIWWNVRDGWPQISDAVVDYYGGKKRAYDAIRNVQHDQLVLVRDDHAVVAVNDTLKPVSGTVRIVDRESGRTLFEATYAVPSNAAKVIGSVDWTGQGFLDIAYEQGGESHTNGFLYGEPPFDFEKVKAWLK